MNFFLGLIVGLFSVSAFASKARVASLLGATHLVDTQTVFTSPSHLLDLDPYVTFEMGAAGTNAEGGIMEKIAGGKLLVYLGHQNTTDGLLAGDIRTSNSYLGQVNPVEVIFAKGNMAFGGSLSMVDNKQSSTKETTLVGKWGMSLPKNSGWIYAHLHLISNAEKAGTGGNDKITAGPYITAGANYSLSRRNRVFGELDISQGEIKPNGADDSSVKDTNISLGFQRTFLRKQKVDAYYGVMLVNEKRDIGDSEISTLQVPAFLGMEHMTLSWLTLRVSVAQNVLIGSTKNNTQDADGVGANTTVAGGLGIRHQDMRVDGTLTAASDGNINANTILANASVTYSF